MSEKEAFRKTFVFYHLLECDLGGAPLTVQYTTSQAVAIIELSNGSE